MATSGRHQGDVKATSWRRQGDIKATSKRRQGDIKATSKRRQGDISATPKRRQGDIKPRRQQRDTKPRRRRRDTKATSAGHQPSPRRRKRDINPGEMSTVQGRTTTTGSSVTVAIQRYSHCCRWQTLEVHSVHTEFPVHFQKHHHSSNVFRTSRLQQREFTRFSLRHAPKRHQISYCTCAQQNHTHKRTAFLARDPITDSETALLQQSR